MRHLLYLTYSLRDHYGSINHHNSYSISTFRRTAYNGDHPKEQGREQITSKDKFSAQHN
jgi:hypothetical protein